MAESSIAKAYVQVIPTTTGIKSQLSNTFGDAGNASGNSFGANLVSTIKGIIAAAGIGKMLGESITAGADLQQSLGGVETIFKDHADTVIASANNAYKTSGLSANAYMEQVTSFSASLLDSLEGDTQEAAAVADMAMTDMSDNSNKFGTDMELVQNAYQGFAKQNYTMLDNLKLGYGGTRAEMERLLADAQELTGVEYNIDNLDDVYTAIHAIQEEMDIAGTTAKESTETIAGSFASMKAAYTNVLADLALGRDVEASLQALTETASVFLLNNLLPAVGNVLSGLPAVLSTAFRAAIQALNIAADNADTLLQQGTDLIISIGSAIVTALPYLAEAAVNIVAAIGTAIISTDWVKIGKDTIHELRSSLDLAAGEILGTDGNIVQSVLDAITAGMPSILQGGVEIVVELANGILNALPDLLATAGDLMDQLLDAVLSGLLDMFKSGTSLVKQLADGLMANLPEITKSAVLLLSDLLATIASYLPELLVQGGALIGEMAAGMIVAIPGAVIEIFNNIVEEFGTWDWRQIGADVAQGIADGIANGASAIWQAAKDAASSALTAAKKMLGINSPSKVMRDEVGKFIPEGIAVGNEANTKPLTDTMHDLSRLTTDTAVADVRGSLEPSADGKLRSVGGKTVTVSVRIDHFENHTDQDLDELAETLAQKIQTNMEKEENSLA